jgi:ribosome-associated protein
LAAQRSGAREFAVAAAELAADTRCDDVVIYDLRGRSPVTEFFVIATGTSPRQMRTVIDELHDLGKQMGLAAWQTSGYESARWIVLDCVNVVIHVFDTESRDFYDLDLLWGDSPRIDWRKELGRPPEAERPARPPLARPDEVEPEDAVEGVAENEDEDLGDEPPVEVEIPDESTGSNSVEFLEIDSPRTRGQRGHTLYPTLVPEPEDTTEEERAIEPMSAVPEAAEEAADEEAQAMPPAKKRKATVRKKPATKTAKTKAAKKPAAKKKPAKSAAKPRKKAK